MKRARNSKNPTSQRKSYNSAPKQSKKKTKKKSKAPVVISVILILAAILLLGYVYLFPSFSDGTGALVPVDMEKGKLNVLVLGVDKDGLRTDSIMLVSYDMNYHSAKLLSIPRDTKIDVADKGIKRKINEVHAMHDSEKKLLGPRASVAAVEALTSVPIHYYIEMNFDAIDKLADILGPVEFTVPDIEGNGQGMNYDDPAQDLHIHLKPGKQKLSGNQYQQFLRYRKSNNGTSDGSDLSRVSRQQEFVTAIVDQKLGISFIPKIPSIYRQLKKNLKTNFSASDMRKYSKYLKGFSGDRIKSFSLPGSSKREKAWYFIFDPAKTSSLIKSEFEYSGENLTNVINVNHLKGTSSILSSKGSSNATVIYEPTPEENEAPVVPEEQPEPTPAEEVEEKEEESDLKNESDDNDNEPMDDDYSDDDSDSSQDTESEATQNEDITTIPEE